MTVPDPGTWAATPPENLYRPLEYNWHVHGNGDRARIWLTGGTQGGALAGASYRFVTG